MPMPPNGLRERKKRRTRQVLEETAWRLFLARGFDETTIGDIASAADVSPRTFFRYFDSKEAVLFGDWRSGMRRVGDLLLARPPGEPPLEALRSVTLLYATELQTRREELLSVRRLARRSRTIKDYQWATIMPMLEQSLVEALAERLKVDPIEDPRPSFFAGVAVAAFRAAQNRWLDTDTELSLFQLVEQSYDLLSHPTVG